MEKEKISTTKLTEKYIEGHPYIKETLKQGLINYSSLARQIADDLEIKKQSSFDAILVASRRYAEKIKLDGKLEEKIIKLLNGSKLEIKNKIGVVIVSQHIPFSQLTKIVDEFIEQGETFQLIQGTKTVTIIIPDNFLEKVEKNFAGTVVSSRKGLVQITIKTSPDIEIIPGVVGYLYSLFAQNGINIFETMSSWAETLIIIDEKDLPKAMEILKF